MAHAAPAPTLIPFQGRLTDQAGTAYTNGQFTLIFNLYDQAVGGNVLWTETHQKVGVVNGMVNVFLGSINPALAGVDFSQTRHLGITIDADNNKNTPDPEMVPRQMIIPAFAAKNAEKLAGYDWSPIFGANNPSGTIPGSKLTPASITSAQLAAGAVLTTNIANGQITVAKLANEVAQLLVPAGAVSAFAGTNLTMPPTGWFFCDGSAVSRTTFAALFAAIGTAYGPGDGSTTFHLPDYRGMFLRGIANIPDRNITAVDTANETVTVANHPYRRNGIPVRFTGMPPGGLATATTYYTIYVNKDTLAFAVSEQDATAANPVKVDLTMITSTGVLVQAVDIDMPLRRGATGSIAWSGIGGFQLDQLVAHTHRYIDYFAGNIPSDDASDRTVGGPQTSAWRNTDPVGGAETRPKNVYVNYIIKY